MQPIRGVWSSQATVAWKRSLFNGLAQIIVQAGRTPGDLTLTATGDGLKPVTLKIATTAAPIRPVVPW